MSRITYTDAERDLMNLSIRKGQVLRKLACLVGSEIAENQIHEIPLEDFIGKGFDDRDSRMILKTVTTMRAIVEEAWLRHGSLFVKFRPEALSMIRKNALQAVEYPPRGNGVAYCEAALALKRALGMRDQKSGSPLILTTRASITARIHPIWKRLLTMTRGGWALRRT